MDFAALMVLHSGHEESRLLAAAVRHDLFTLIARLEDTTGEAVAGAAIAGEAGWEPRATELFLNALSAVGLLEKERPQDPERPLEGGAFRLAPITREHLVAGAEHDLGGFLRFDHALWNRWEHLDEALRTGKPAKIDHMHQADPDATRRFIDAMESIARARGDAETVAQRVDLARALHLLDVGGGSGAYSIAFLKAHPHLTATIIDLPATLEVTKDYVEKQPAAIQRRIRLVPCDYNTDAIPPPPPTSSLPDDLVAALKIPDELHPKLSEGYDAVWVSNILHGEDEAANRRLAGRIYEALRPGGRVIIKEHVLDATLTRPANGAIFAIHMLLNTKGGRCYGFDETRRWYEDAGFVDVKETPPRAPLTSSLFTAKRPGGGLADELGRAAKILGEDISHLVRGLTPRTP